VVGDIHSRFWVVGKLIRNLSQSKAFRVCSDPSTTWIAQDWTLEIDKKLIITP
jgi:hypothetical protein